MRSISLRAWLLVILSAGLQVSMFPTGGPMPVWRASLCWFALLPLLVALALPGKDGLSLSLRNSLLLGYLCGCLWYFGNCFWIYQTMYLYGGLPKPVSFGIVILFSLYLGLYHALFAGLFSVLFRGRGGLKAALGLTPFLWVAVELARARITGFPWDLLGNTLVDNLLVTRLAPLAGVMAISFLVVFVNALLATLFCLRGRPKSMAITGLVLLSLLELAGRLTSKPVRQPSDSAVLLQENLAVGEAAKSVEPIAPTDELQIFSQLTLQKAQTAQSAPTIFVWPEAPARLFSINPEFQERIGALARTMKMPGIVGSLGIDRTTENERGYFQYDSASLFAPDGSSSGRYDKIHRVPWGEYIPYQEFFGFAHKLTAGAGDNDAGRERTVFHAAGHTYGVFICYESIFGDEVRQFVDNGAEVLVNISDDGWYGETGAPWQHLNMARMRAIENHRWVLRSTNTGVTTSIDPEGRVTAEAPRHVRAAFILPFAFEEGTTFYTRHGDWFAYLCALVSLVGVGMGWVKSPRLR